MTEEKTKKPNYFKKAYLYLIEHPATLIFVLSYSLTFINESFNRHSVWEALVFEFTKPLLFLINMSIIALTLAPALLSKKRNYWLATISVVWFGLGLTNFIVLFFRISPFSAMDFSLVLSIFPILPVYLGWVGLIACFALLLGAIISVIVAWFKAKKIKIKYTRAAVTLLVIAIVATAFIGGGSLLGIIPDHFSSLRNAYLDCGFNLCFSISFDHGVSKPKAYKNDIDDVIAFLDNGNGGFAQPEKTPNIIFVQLESFYDLKLLSGFEFSEDPCPIFTELKNSCSSGILTVPSIGAGTVNTEFEVLTGMSVLNFKPGEYPYRTFLLENTTESVPHLLKKYGYTSHAVHNYKATFYDRHKAFSSLGFDTFTSKEYMNLHGENLAQWEKDSVLTKNIMYSLMSTEGADFVQCITVQGHGKYPIASYSGEDIERIKPTSLPANANKHSYTYYANQLHDTDKFIGELIEDVEEFSKENGEETVIVFYGDHIPNIGFEENWLPNGMTLFDTEYIIWRTDGGEEEDKNLTSYQLHSEIFSLLGFEGGYFTKLHQKRAVLSEADYQHYLHCLQYDMVEDNAKNTYGGEIPYKATKVKFGVIDITITDIYVFGEHIYVKGTGFTQASRIYVNGTKETTEFIDDDTLILSGVNLNNGDKIRVTQMADIFTPALSSTETFIYNEKTPEEQE